ncbi:MAG TPA: sulfatase-like hydrolase/transferase [Lacipirellulaceae bacterium]|nr:sulfatase-like hydrolase/transferase [Lacipirellulaceae bacterium]
MYRFVAALTAMILTYSGIPAAFAAAPRPNIILILSDDVGLGDVHFTGGPFKTPNIDKLASGGTQFTYCYSTPLCGPSRCETLTGRYPFHTGMISNQAHKAVDPTRDVMIPTVLRKAGYATASVGKWGQIQLGPGEWGFDEYIVFPGSGRYWRAQTKTYTVNGEKHDLPEGKYLPDLMHQFAADFITRHKNRPFFLYYPMSHIHGPIVRTPDTKEGADKDQLYIDNVEYMDKLVGKLMNVLDRLHLREKTVVLFTGDNGTARFGVQLATVDGRHISGRKGTMLEGGSRVPLAVNWPGHTPSGKVNNDLIDFSDFFATFADLAGAPLPDAVKLDSHSFAPQIEGQKGSPRDWVCVELYRNSYVRDARFKLTNEGDLFDLSNAPFEEIPVAKDTTDPAAIAARKKLQAILDQNPVPPGRRGAKPKKRRNRSPDRQGAGHAQNADKSASANAPLPDSA